MSFSILGLGCGEGGGRIASSMIDFGVNIGCLNTNFGDLAGLKNIPEYKKLLVEISGGGSGKDPNFVKQSMKDPILRSKIVDFIKGLLNNTPILTTCSACGSEEKIKDTEAIGDHHLCLGCGNNFGISFTKKAENIKHDYLLLFACLGGGSGSGLIGEIVDICIKSKDINIPIGAICTLPDDSEDTVTKVNAVSVFKDLYMNYAKKGILSPLILVDNQKMQEIIDAPIGSMYQTINKTVTGLVDKFNKFSNQTSEFMTTMDTLDTGRLWSLGGCCSIGKFIVGNSKKTWNKGSILVPHPLALNEVEPAMKECTFVDGFDLSSAQGVGIIAVAPRHFLADENISACIRYTFGKAKEIIGDGLVMRGQYNDEATDCLEFYVFYNGLMYPEERFEKMWDEIKEGKAISEKKRNRLDEFSYDAKLESSNQDSNFKKLQSLKSQLPESDEFIDTRAIEAIQKKMSTCNNCFVDPIRKISLGVYKKNGPQPFTGKVCPICSGRGKI